ncbi:unnamed protein product [Orchesella dallaii]|uniref:Decaprenyl-diphosphate synthase subunit 2 n=1 Tax=Orchesella dallaii TaxID=48710 RepID=A0ABP1QUM4_9HEXA
MFTTSKCLLIVTRTNRYVQSRSIRKSSHLKYSAPSVEGLSSKLQVKRSHSHNIIAAAAESFDEKALPHNYSDSGSHSMRIEYPDSIIASKKVKLEELIRRAEDLLKCRFHRSRSSPIGVGISLSDNDPRHFNLLPKWFQNDSSFVASKIPGLMGSGHPILSLKKNIDSDDEEHSLTLLSSNVQWRAFIMLLVARAFGMSKEIQQGDKKFQALVDAKQRSLSEITEMMHFAFALHRTMVEINHSNMKDVPMEEESGLHLGNKIATLLGDLLMARTSKGLSSLRNHEVTELMSDAIGDFSESEILRRRHLDFFRPVPSESAEVFREFAESNSKSKYQELPSYETWHSRVSLDISSLIGRSCLCSTKLSQHDEEANKLAFSIGHQIGLVMQACNDLELYTRARHSGHPTLDLCTLPAVFHFNSDSVDRAHRPIDINEVYRKLMTSPDVIVRTQNALESLKQDALELISKLPRSTQAPQILEDFVVTLS